MKKRHGNKPFSVRRGMGLMLLIGGLLVAVLMAAITIHLAVVIRDRANEHFNANTTYHGRLFWDDQRRIWQDESYSPEEREAYYYNYIYSVWITNSSYYWNIPGGGRSFLPAAEREEFASPEPIDGEYFVLVADPEGQTLVRQTSYFEVRSESGEWDIIVELPEDFNVKKEYGASHYTVEKALIEGVMISPWKLRLTKLVSRNDGEEKILYQGEVAPGEQVETFTNDFLIFFNTVEPTSGFTVHGVHYRDLEEYAMTFLEKSVRTENDPERSAEAYIAHYGLWQLVSIQEVGIPSLTADTYDTVVIVGRCSPLFLAAKSLWWFYAASIGAWVIFWQAIRKQMKKRLLRQVSLVTNHMQGDSQYFYQDPDATKGFQEAEDLVRGYGDLLEKQRRDQNEITRLNTALDYAKEAEERRRAMTSALAHELKTPLAVVHGYAEGLQQNIAAKKREAYLNTILSETERMDAMVLEMLDLSRLEAGRVKLARDQVDLVAQVRGLVEKLEPLAEARGLAFQVEAPEALPVMADEVRMAQVMENFCSNALRYAKEGTAVQVGLGYGDAKEVRRTWIGNHQSEEGAALPSFKGEQGDGPAMERGNKVSFVIENETEKPLSGEEFSRVWETFYRGDKARSEKGTGLGLAIAKNIIQLHNGTVLAERTKKGVRFSFTIPV